jgi:MFS family permease
VIVDVSPLRGNRDFQLFFVSRALSSVARQVVVVAVPLQIFAMTGSSLAVGLIGAVQLIPLFTVALVGGALADALDRKWLLIIGQGLTAATCVGLALLAFAGTPPLWSIYLLVALNAAVFAVEQPTRTAVLPTIVSSSDLPSALALNQVLGQVSKAAVPALTGLLVVVVGTGPTYIFAATSAGIGALVLRGVMSLAPVGGGTAFGYHSILEGIRYLRRAPLIKGALIVDLNAMVFGMPSALFPEIGTEVLGGDAAMVGLLYAAPGIGALLAALTSGWLPRVRRQGMTIIISVVAWGLAIAAFGFATSAVVAVPLLALAGAADVVSAVFRNTVVQVTVSDDFRGRISSVHIATVSGGPRLGDLEAGVVAALTSTRFSVVSGGLACALGALLIGKLTPQLRRYENAELAPLPEAGGMDYEK